MKRPFACVTGLLNALALLLAGCAAGRPSGVVLAESGGSASLFGQFAAYETATGLRLPLGEVVRRMERADVVFFGEEHGNVVCNQLQATLFDALLAHSGRHALAMEFFEADTQAALDAYLDGKLDESEFMKQTRQGRGYWTAHRPLVERSREAGAAVLAANAPRRLVRAFRVSELEYDAFLETVKPEDRRWIPSHSERLGGTYEQRFFDLMGGHNSDPSVPDEPPPTTAPATHLTSLPAPLPASRPAEPPPAEPASGPTSQPATAPATMPATQPAAESQPAAAETQPSVPEAPAPGSSVERFYRSQLMWDDAMAESIANHRKRHPRESVILIVGAFHVSNEGGTVQKYRSWRPDDRTLTVVFVGTQDGRFPLDAADRAAGDIVIYGITPPPPEDAK